MDADRYDRLVSLRRELHRHPEPAWREFYTTARLVEECERIGVDDLVVGPDLLASGERLSVPDEDELGEWYERALDAGADEEVLEQLRGGWTGLLATLERGEGPTVALRVDIDGLPREESTDPGHYPAAEGFRSETGAMHACGHDGHAAIGVGVLEAVAESDFAGTLKVLFQPAEEVVGGARPVAESGHLDDVDVLLAVHLGLDHPTGEVVAGVEDILAVSQFRADFEGDPAHAGGHPAQGRNAVQALATAVQNLYGIPRHEAGATRVNAGVVEGGTATNIVPEHASIEGEVRGETTELMEYMRERADDVIENAADMHRCEVGIESTGEAPSAENDPALVDLGYEAAGRVAGVDSRVRTAALGGSEDATYLMRRVQETGGEAAYVCVGTDHPGGHHTATFDVDEPSIAVGVDWLAETLLAAAEAER
ncbi:amidohydrolase [Halomicrobium salinisoli]|uniref:amidohydrolase n=1 Tax=Halomicrobium salinisoli TaxID=2878391 RepID=UPI001CF009FC|nr:amidohydrolase [Halomicrobium salinisoli]